MKVNFANERVLSEVRLINNDIVVMKEIVSSVFMLTPVVFVYKSNREPEL